MIIARSVGADGGGITLAAKLVEALSPAAFVTVMVISDVPIWFGAGASVMMRVVPEPLTMILFDGNTFGFDDAIEKRRLFTSASLTVNIVATGTLRAVETPAILLMLGGVWF